MNLAFFLAAVSFIVVTSLLQKTLYTSMRASLIILGVFIVIRFWPAFYEAILSKARTTREDRLICGIVFSWTGQLIVSSMIVPYRLFADDTMALTTWIHPYYGYLLPAGIACMVVGATLHLVSQRAPLTVTTLNKWAAIGIPMAAFIAVAVVLYGTKKGW